MAETMTTQASSPSAQGAAKPPLSSDLEEFVVLPSSSEFNQLAQSVHDCSTFKSTPSTPSHLLASSHTPVVKAEQSPGSHSFLTSSMDLGGHGYGCKSSPLLSTSGSPTPPTPQSHCSASSPLSHQMTMPDGIFVTLPPPPYPTGNAVSNVEHTMMPPNISVQSPVDQTKPGVLPPPKKPLTPYMRFSKSIWQKVKAVNQNSSVCEIGATIGRMWREMNDVDKQHYNEDFIHDKARYDGELQTYLKATGLQASDLAKPKAKKPRTVAPSVSRPPPMSTTDGGGVGYVDGVGVNDGGGAASGFQQTAGNGVVSGGLPHFCQVWSGNVGSDAYGADKLLAQMDAEGQSTLFTNQSVTDAEAVLSFREDVNQQVASMYNEQNQMVNSGVANQSNQQQQQQSQDTAAMTNWLWQQYAIANGDQFGTASSSDSLHQNGADPSTGGAAGNMIIYQLNADGTQTAFAQPSTFTQPIQPTNCAPAPAADVLEPGEVRVAQNGPASSIAQQQQQQQQLYQHGVSALGYQVASNGQWTGHDTGSSAVTAATDAEKQLLRGALVDKVREIQRLTRELEQAYALIHQLKQHNEFLQRQWGQAMVQPAATDSAVART